MKKVSRIFAALMVTFTLNLSMPVMAQGTTDNTTSSTTAGDDDDGDGGRWGLAGLLGLLGLLGLKRRDDNNNRRS